MGAYEMMKFEFLVPTTLNDETPVSASYLQGVADQLAILCGGSSLDETAVKGIWYGDGGHRFEDNCKRFCAVAERSLLNDVMNIVTQIGKELKQEAMFIEVSEYDGPQILKIADNS